MAHFDSKIFNPNVFGKYVDRIPNLKRNELLKSGVLEQRSDFLSMFNAQTGSVKGTVPIYGLLDGKPTNYDGNTDIAASTTTTYSQEVVCIGRAKGFTEMDFSEDVTGGVDFMDNVAAQVAEYWDGIDQDLLLSILKGVFAMTAPTANKTFVEKHTYDISGAEHELDQKVNQTTLNKATQQACGDNKKIFKVVLMHSEVATTLENLNLLEYLKYTDSQGIQRDLGIATWNGKLVIIDDEMPTEDAEEGKTKYTSYVLGTGAIQYCNVGAKVPYEMHRDPKTNGGVDTLYTRQRKVFAPKGISFVGTPATNSPTDAELENGSNWSLIKDPTSSKYINHKAIAIARIISLG